MEEHVKTCSIEGCSGPVAGWGWCFKHYKRWKVHGDPLVSLLNREGLVDDDGRECADCGQYKTWDNFHRSSSSSTGHVSACKSCRNKKGRERHVKYAYGMSLAVFQAMLDAQGNACDACRKVFSESRDICVDHSHACCPGERSCGECVRALLCQDCNISLGRMGECPDRLRALAAYVERYAVL